MRMRLVGSLLSLTLICAAQEHAGQSNPGDLQRGSRLYAMNCSLCHGVSGDGVTGADLSSGRFKRAASDDELGRVILAGIPGTAMPPHKLDSDEARAIVAYVRSLRQFAASASGGDAGRGRALFESKGECLKCHRVAARGSRFGPDLTDIGLIRQTAALERSLADPSGAMLPFNRSIRAVTREGQVVVGRRLNEDTYSVQLIDTDERLVSLIKGDLREYTVSKVSAMPSYRDRFSAQEMADVVAYLRTLRGVE